MVKTIIYRSLDYGDWVICNNCETQMLLSVGTEICPVCGAKGCMSWVDDNKPEMKADDIKEVEYWKHEDTRICK